MEENVINDIDASDGTQQPPRPRGKMRRWLYAAAAVVCVALGVGIWAASVAFDTYDGPDVRIYIPGGSTAAAISDTLSAHLGSGYAGSVMRAWRGSGGSAAMAEGSYVVKPGTRALRLARCLQRGAQDPVRLTFNNVRTLADLAQRVGAKMEFAPADFLAACDSVLPAKGYKPREYPAAFLPDTYEFYWTAPASDVVRRLSEVRDKFWTPERQAQAQALGLTKVQVATLASIVEEETVKSDERGKVARLYLNRLSRGIMLQADPTVKFAVGDFSLRRILGKHLAIDSPYNTYKYPGLPPGPIRIPERSTLEKVLSAPEHPYIYMCAKEDFSGYHNFATSYDEHQTNARRYHKALTARGITAQ